MTTVRSELKKQEGVRKKFRGTFVREGSKINYMGYKERTILLKNVVDIETNKLVTDHLWFTYVKNFEKIELCEGAVVEFEARIRKYVKGYVNAKYGINNSKDDYRLSHPTKVKLV